MRAATVNHQLLRSPENLLPKSYLKGAIDESKDESKDKSKTLFEVTRDLDDSLSSLIRVRRTLALSMRALGNVPDDDFRADLDVIVGSLSAVITDLRKPVNYMVNVYSNDDSKSIPNRFSARRRLNSTLSERLHAEEVVDEELTTGVGRMIDDF